MIGAISGNGEKGPLAFSPSKKWRLARALGALRRGATASPLFQVFKIKG